MTGEGGLTYWTAPGEPCPYCGALACDSCPLCCHRHPRHRRCRDCPGEET